MKKNSFLYGTFILIIVNFIIRFLGFGYKIILSRMIGAEGIGLFHIIFHVLLILLTFTTSGLPIAISKLVASNLSLNNKRGCHKVLGLSLLIGLFISSGLSVFLFYFSKYISLYVIKNKDIYPSLIFLIPALPIITLTSIFRGYFYGIKNMEIPGTSQILEQIFRIVFVVGCIYMLSPLPIKYASMIAVIGISVGEFIGLIYLLFKFNIFKILHFQRSYHLLKKTPSRSILSKLVLISTPITLTRLLATTMQSINAVLVPQKLQLAGYTPQESIIIFGKLAGMALPLLFLPFIVTSALAVNIIPSVSEEMAVKNFKSISLKSTLCIRITLLASIPTTALFMFFATPLCNFIYDDADVGKYLSLLALGSIFLCLHHTATGILHGLGKQNITTIHHILGMSLQLICTYYLVENPKFAENGFIIGFLLAVIIMCSLDLTRLRQYVRLNIQFLDNILKPIIATVVMILFITNVHTVFVNMNLNPTMNMIFSLLMGSLSYATLILLSGSINLKTLKYIFTKK